MPALTSNFLTLQPTFSTNRGHAIYLDNRYNTNMIFVWKQAHVFNAEKWILKLQLIGTIVGSFYRFLHRRFEMSLTPCEIIIETIS